jgi:hypothetical protein
MTAQQRESAYADWREVYDAEIEKWTFTHSKETR